MPVILIGVLVIVLALFTMPLLDNQETEKYGLIGIGLCILLILWVVISAKMDYNPEKIVKTYKIYQSEVGIQYSVIDDKFFNINTKFGRVVDIEKTILQVSMPKNTIVLGIKWRPIPNYKLIENKNVLKK